MKKLKKIYKNKKNEIKSTRIQRLNKSSKIQ